MAATLYNLIVIGCTISYDGTVSTSFKNKLNCIAGMFSSLRGFKTTSIDRINRFTTVEGELCFKPLTPKEETAVRNFQREIDLKKSIVQNFTVILTKQFVNKQLLKIDEISVEEFNANPILCKALNLKTPEEFIRYNAYQAIGRSIVTSMGFLVQNLLLYSNEYIFDGKTYKEGDKTKFDLVIDRLGEVKSFLEIKSGFNDLDAGQVKHYCDEINLVEATGNRAYIGITYGKKNSGTVSEGLFRTYVEDWERKVLVGRELWDFISENDNYHILLIATIDEVANTMLHNVSVVQKIEEKINRLINKFKQEYSSLEAFYETLW